MRRSLAAVPLALLLALVGCSDSTSSTPSSAPTPSSTASAEQEELSFEIIGTCTSEAGTLTSVSSGFTPGGNYTTEAWYPNGDPYLGLDNPGRVADNGSTPAWNWNCALGENEGGDPPGEYRVKITDNATGRSIETTLTVHEP